MQVFLEDIWFNHDETSKTTGALTIRRNETQVVTLPEWQRNSCSSPECAPAAYAISHLPEPITIKAKFSSPDLKSKSIQIQAISPAADVLGPVESTSVQFNEDGYSDFVTFSLRNSRLAHVGMSVHTTSWDWQFYSAQADCWREFQHTKHRIFAVWTRPTEPWDTELPWTEVLEIACQWADGAHDLDVAARRITEQVYALGNRLVKYARSPTYAHKKFDCTAFLRLLREGISRGQTMNCDDCAAIVSTFANILGCDLSQSGMGYDFRTHPILLIGESQWAGEGFPRHAVAWKGACVETDALFDACFKVDSDGTPSIKGQDPLLPANLLFGQSQEDSYRSFMFKEGNCDPQPQFEKIRRKMGRTYLGSRRFTDLAFITFLKEQYEFDACPSDQSLNKGEFKNFLALPQYLLQNSDMAGWNLYSLEAVEEHDVATVEILLRQATDTLNFFGINLYQTLDTINPSDFFLQLLGQFHQLLDRHSDPPIGEVAFTEPNATAVVLKRGSSMAVVRSVGRTDVSGLNIASKIDAFFIELS